MNSHQKVIVVSGCTKGIGRAICNHFAANGFSIVGYARSNADVSEMQNALQKQYPKQQFYLTATDASNKKEVLAFATFVQSKFLHVDVLVNNAGVFLPGSILEEKDGTLETLIETNVYSAYYLTKALHKNIKRNIFNICSIASLQAYPAGASYTISKFALLGFSKQLREELMHSNIKVTSVMPGAVLTNSWSGTDLPESRFIQSVDIGKMIYSVYELSEGAVVEELLIRPQLGDI
ncbi:short-chain dehydrogenase [Bacteroidetes bacterium UKL13-3]|jgi:short-subunit dehydrogenase|nr:short-chain dehydrogenase [Bacteroidetes bacterium UKL13-3]HCP92826.1 short-chain dehydrogenase [Bacteroidota bacterium]